VVFPEAPDDALADPVADDRDSRAGRIIAILLTDAGCAHAGRYPAGVPATLTVAVGDDVGRPADPYQPVLGIGDQRGGEASPHPPGAPPGLFSCDGAVAGAHPTL